MRLYFVACGLFIVSLGFSCGSGGDTSGSGAGGAGDDTSGSGGGGAAAGGSGGAPADNLEKAIAAAAAAAESDPACAAIAGTGSPTGFYWEIGDARGALAAASIGGFTKDTTRPVGSACKLVSAAYFLEKMPDLTAEAGARLRFLSGYAAAPATCAQDATVAECFDSMGGEQGFDASKVGHYFYGPAHMQELGISLGLGDLDGAALGAELRSSLGIDSPDLGFAFASFAGGAAISPAVFGEVLRGVLAGKYELRAHLGKDRVCTTDCGYETYTPSSEPWRYSYGHWVEDGCGQGTCDGAYSTLGAAGFYAWLDASARYYGVLGHFEPPLAGKAVFMEAAYCGQSIRRAFLDEMWASPDHCGAGGVACEAGQVCCAEGCGAECL